MAPRMTTLTVVRGSQATSSSGRRSQIEGAYDHFRIDRKSNLVTPATLEFYEHMTRPFFGFLREEGCLDFASLDVNVVRRFRVWVSERKGKHGQQLSPNTVQAYHRAYSTFLRWASLEGYPVDGRILLLKRPRTQQSEPDLYHLAQLRKILAACNPAVPEEEVAVRIAVGSGLRISELCGLCVAGPDGLSDLMLDSLERGRVELRVRWDAGAKGRKSRRVPVTPRLAAAIKRYESKHRPETFHPELLINRLGRPYRRFGLDSLFFRLRQRTGLSVHAHAFRHTFATVATQMGWNFERLRSAMGHSDYGVLQGYVRLASDRDLGPLKEWTEFIMPPAEPSSWR
jgi:integrase/recombinase XerD